MTAEKRRRQRRICFEFYREKKTLIIENEKRLIWLFHSKTPKKIVDFQKSSGYNDRQRAGQKDGIQGSRIVSTITEY
jgi:hypothetical protein